MKSDAAFLRLFLWEPDDLTPGEIRTLLDKELGKAEPDPVLIEYYLDALDEAGRNIPAAPAKIRRFTLKSAVAAAAAALLLVFGVSAAAAVLQGDLPGVLIRLYNDRIRVGHTDEDTAADEAYAFADSALGQDLAAHGISPVLLPEGLVNGAYTVDRLDYEATDLINSANIRFSNGKISGSVHISVYADGAALPVTDYSDAENVSLLQTDRIECCIFDQAGHTVVDFSDGRTVYSVLLTGDRAAAKAFAESIK